MACMEHVCNKCEHLWFNNQARDKCPKCGSMSVYSTFDEPMDDDRDDDRDD